MVKIVYSNDLNLDELDLYSFSTKSQEHHNNYLNQGAPRWDAAKAHIWNDQTVGIVGYPGDRDGSKWVNVTLDDTTIYEKAIRMGQGIDPDFSRLGILGDDLNLVHLNNYTDYSISGTVEALTDIGFDE